MLPIQKKLCNVTKFTTQCNGDFTDHNEVFLTLVLGDNVVFGIENTYCNDGDDFGIVVTPQDGLTKEDFINSNILKVCLTSNIEWRHTDDDKVVHIAVHTTSGSFKVSIYNEHDTETPFRKVVLQSPHLCFTNYI